MKTHRISSLLIPTLASALALGACGTEMDDADDTAEISDAIELDNGGISMTDEQPSFGDPTLFDSIDESIEVSDSMDTDVDVVSMRERPDVVVYRAIVLWGMMPPNPEAETARDWTGRLTIDRGAIIVRRTIGFEDSDGLLPRDSRDTVAFHSVTRPHVDGLLLEILDPTPATGAPLTLTYQTPEGVVYSTTLAALREGPVSEPVDDLGNRIAGVALARPVDLCEHGFLRGRWHAVRPGLGRMLGQVVGADGTPKGHIRGIWGQKADGKKVFFGKYINRDGEFRGIFAGHYGEGHFEGRWLTRAGEFGRLGGEYRESLPGARVGGHFLGRWAETSCAVDLSE